MRTRLAVAVTLFVTAAAAGKPPELPLAPPTEGREPPPVAREYYLAETKPACGPTAAAPADPRAFWEALRRALPTVFGHAWDR
jgi:hypothetical protein